MTDEEREFKRILTRRVNDIVRAAKRGQERINAGLPVDGRVGMAANWL